jgi:polysaccharide biosynthesis protein PslH
MRILFITDTVPYPPLSGNQLRVYNLCRRIAKECELWLAVPLNRTEDTVGVSHMREICHEVITATRRQQRRLQHVPGLIRYALAGKPLEYKFEHCEELLQKIRSLAPKVDFDIVHIEPSYMALYLEALPPDARCKSFLTFHNIEFSLFQRLSRHASTPIGKARAFLHSMILHRWEPHYAERFDLCITVSEVDRHLLTTSNPRLRTAVSPNGFDTQQYQPLPMPQETARPSLLFVGSMSYEACADAMVYFCQEILPRIRCRVGDLEMWIVGRDPSARVRQLHGNGVHVTGRVADVRPYYHQSMVCVVPLRAGGGTRLKILEAMALGRPVVSTSIGCEGLDVVDEEHLMIADSPEQFAEKTVRLLTDAALRQRISTNARQLVVARYDWDVIAMRLMHIYTQVA